MIVLVIALLCGLVVLLWVIGSRHISPIHPRYISRVPVRQKHIYIAPEDIAYYRKPSHIEERVNLVEIVKREEDMIPQQYIEEDVIARQYLDRLQLYNEEEDAIVRGLLNVRQPVAQPAARGAGHENDAINVAFRADTQNVHDRAIQKQIREKFTTTESKNVSGVASSVKDEILKVGETIGVDSDALKNVIQKIEKRNSDIYGLRTTEFGVLTKTWSGANTNVREQIVRGLLDSRIGDEIVCPTGVITRIIESTFVENPETMPKSANALRIEMLNKASKLKQDFDIANPGLSDADASKKFTSLLFDTFSKDYKGIVPDSTIRDELNEWASEI